MRFKLFSMLMILLLVALLTPGCNPQPKETTIRFGNLPYLGYGPWIVAEKMGYLKEQGITLNTTMFEVEQPEIEAMLGGSIDAAAGADSPIILLAPKAKDAIQMVSVHSLFTGYSIMGRPGEVKTYDEFIAEGMSPSDALKATCAQLVGKTIILSAHNHFHVETICDRVGIIKNGKLLVLNTPGALPEIWSYGHRSVQGIAVHPVTNQLWTDEHGPQGGDELNLDEAGKNYGWPVIGYGVNYRSGTAIHSGTTRAGMEQPVQVWVPSIAVSGLVIYTGDKFPNWQGNFFIGGMAGERLVRLTMDGNKVVSMENLVERQGRVRAIRQGPDGFIYLAFEDAAGGPSKLVRLEPVKRVGRRPP